MRINYLSPAFYFSAFYSLFLIAGLVLNNDFFGLLPSVFFVTPHAASVAIVVYIVSFLVFYKVLCGSAGISGRFSYTHTARPRRVFRIGRYFYVVSFLLFMVFYLKIGAIPAFLDDVENARATAKIGAGKYLILANTFSLVAAVMMASYFHLFSGFQKIIYILLFVLSLIFLSGAGYRAPAAYLVVTSIMSYYVFSGRVSWMKIYSVILLVFLLVVLLGVIRSGGEVRSVFIPVAWTMSVSTYNLATITENYPLRFEYLHGSTFVTDFLASIPGSGYQFFGNVLKSLLGRDFSGEGITITAPGEGYVNFGMLGVVAHAVVTAFIGFLASAYFNNKRDVLFGVAALVFAINFGRIVTAGIMPAFAFFIVPCTFVALVFIQLCIKRKS